MHTHMPQRDKTGPQGKGPKTGRGMGNCTSQTDQKDQDSVGQNVQYPRRGQGQGRNMNRRKSN